MAQSVASLPFVLQVARTSGVSPTPRRRTSPAVGLRYDPQLRRNRVLVDGAWMDVTAAAHTASGSAALAVSAATMTETDPVGHPGGYKLDDQ